MKKANKSDFQTLFNLLKMRGTNESVMYILQNLVFSDEQLRLATSLCKDNEEIQKYIQKLLKKY